MELKNEYVGECYIVRLSSREIIDSVVGQQIATRLRTLVESTTDPSGTPSGSPSDSDQQMQRRVEVDFADVQSLSSANLGGLIQVNREARGLGADLVLTNVGDPVRDIFKLTRLDRMFTFANSTLGSDSICQ